MSETALNAMAQQYLELTLNKSRYDGMDVQWYTCLLYTSHTVYP